MKTTTDIAAFLKRTGASVAMAYDAASDKFIVSTMKDDTRSRYLDDALENLAEAKRRQANDMQPMRDGSTGIKPDTAPATTPVAQKIVWSMAPYPNACPTCAMAPAAAVPVTTGMTSYACMNGHAWIAP